MRGMKDKCGGESRGAHSSPDVEDSRVSSSPQGLDVRNAEVFVGLVHGGGRDSAGIVVHGNNFRPAS